MHIFCVVLKDGMVYKSLQLSLLKGELAKVLEQVMLTLRWGEGGREKGVGGGKA